MTGRGHRIRLAAALLVTMLLAACAVGPSDAAGRRLTVLAAASLTDPFTALAERFEDQRPGTRVELVFGSSATLATQVVEGGRADVLATADERTMHTVVRAGAAGADPRVFATNTLVLAVPAGNPAGIRRLADLEREGVVFLACVPSAPCGATAATLLRRNGIAAEPSSLEIDVRAVLAKVAAGEADAGLVYASDVHGNPDVRRLPVPGAEQARQSYLLAPLEESAEPALADAWVDLVLSAEGRSVLAGAGFGPAQDRR